MQAAIEAWSHGASLIAWLRDGGGYVNSKLVIGTSRAFQDGGVTGVFVREGERVEPNELLAVIPPGRMLAGRFCALLAQLERELDLADGSRFAPYLEGIRRTFDPPAPTLPEYWHDETKALLADLPPYDLERHEKAYGHYCKPQTKAGSKWSESPDRWLQGRRALLLTITRAIDRIGGRTMAPLFDSFNHCAGDCNNLVVSDATNRSLLLTARTRTSGGAQLFNYYPMAAPELLQDYGFVSGLGRAEWHFGRRAGGQRHAFAVEDGRFECTHGCEPSSLMQSATALVQTVGERIVSAEGLQRRLVGHVTEGGLTLAHVTKGAEVDLAMRYLQAMRAALELAVEWAREKEAARTEL